MKPLFKSIDCVPVFGTISGQAFDDKEKGDTED
jgi:hypothetical protein